MSDALLRAVERGVNVRLLLDWIGARGTSRKFLRQIQRGRTGRLGALAADGDFLRLARYTDAVIGSILACLVNAAFLSLLYFSYLWVMLALASAITQVSRARVAAQQTV